MIETSDLVEVDLDDSRPGLVVRLLWSPLTKDLFIELTDTTNNTQFLAPIPPEKAKHALGHPFLYEPTPIEVPKPS